MHEHLGSGLRHRALTRTPHPLSQDADSEDASSVSRSNAGRARTRIVRTRSSLLRHSTIFNLRRFARHWMETKVLPGQEDAALLKESSFSFWRRSTLSDRSGGMGGRPQAGSEEEAVEQLASQITTVENLLHVSRSMRSLARGWVGWGVDGLER